MSDAGVVIWITGLPASGKTTFAQRLRSELLARGVCCVVLLDGDEVRRAVTPALGYNDRDRTAFYSGLGRMAALLARQGLLVIVSATSPLRRHRASARAVAPRFVEVWVRTPVDECERRDPKGLYQRARAGGMPSFPGVTAPYETPVEPEVVAEGGMDDIALAEVADDLLDPAKGALFHEDGDDSAVQTAG
jgi:adenylylsulfate kinase